MVRYLEMVAIAVVVLVMVTGTPAMANRNILSNPGFNGTGGVAVDNVVGDVPDDWRAFSVGEGSAATIEILPLAAGDVYPGSPATNGVNWQVDVKVDDAGFDNNNARFAVKPATTYWSAFYAKSNNSDGTDQGFNLGFPIFDAEGLFLGAEPGGAGGLTATSTWTKFYGPSWANDANATTAAGEAHISWRVAEDGGDDSILIALPSAIEATVNIMQNPEFSGTGGNRQNEEVTGEVPDRYRAFAVGGSEATIDIVPLAEGELYEGSPAVNAVKWQVDFKDGDVGFDNEGFRFPIVPDEDYHAEFYIKTGNDDDSDQTFNLGFPIFGEDGAYLGREPGAQGGLTATSEWTQVIAPTFSDPDARFGHLAWRALVDGGQDAILIAMPLVDPPGEPEIFPPGDVNRDGEVNGLDVDPFVDVLLNGPFQEEADMNEDGEVNGLDVDPFVAAVVGGGVQAVPEPSSWILVAIGGLLLGFVARRRG